MQFIGQNPEEPKKSFPAIEAGLYFHTLSDGTWGLSDVIDWLASSSQIVSLVVSTWTASIDGIDKLVATCTNNAINDLRFLTDFSFANRHIVPCEHLRSVVGDDRIRCWNSHAKFVVATGDVPTLILTSANLNKNKRLENFSVLCDPVLVEQYLDLVDRLFQLQNDGDGFMSSKEGRRDTKALLHTVSDDPMKDLNFDDVDLENLF